MSSFLEAEEMAPEPNAEAEDPEKPEETDDDDSSSDSSSSSSSSGGKKGKKDKKKAKKAKKAKKVKKLAKKALKKEKKEKAKAAEKLKKEKEENRAWDARKRVATGALAKLTPAMTALATTLGHPALVLFPANIMSESHECYKEMVELEKLLKKVEADRASGLPASVTQAKDCVV